MAVFKISQGTRMRSKSDSSTEEDKGRRSEGTAAPVTQDDSWEFIEMSEQEDQAGRLMQDLFGEALAKLQYLVLKDKKKFDKLSKEKRHGN
jgi:hypothetical protein